MGFYREDITQIGNLVGFRGYRIYARYCDTFANMRAILETLLYYFQQGRRAGDMFDFQVKMGCQVKNFRAVTSNYPDPNITISLAST